MGIGFEKKINWRDRDMDNKNKKEYEEREGGLNICLDEEIG